MKTKDSLTDAQVPEIRINFSQLLYDNVSRDKYQFYAKIWGNIPSIEQCEEWTESYRQEWHKHQQKIMEALCSVLGVNFRKSIIDVSVAPGIRAISDPLIMNFLYFPDQFVDSLTHELIHILLTDNTKFGMKDTFKGIYLDKEWAKLYGEHDFETLVHIPVHAIHKYIYLDVIQSKKRLKRDIKDTSVPGSESYVRAWEYVNEHNYKEIIKNLKTLYNQLEHP